MASEPEAGDVPAKKAKPKKSALPDVGSADVPLLDLDAGYEIVVMDRRELKEYPFNPRTISDKGKAKLRAVLKGLKLLHPAACFNKRNGQLVGGHKRLGELDALHGSPAYRLRVAVVDLDEKGHAEACMALNNGEAGGDWDITKLGEMFKRKDMPALEVENTGFDIADLYRVFGASPYGENANAALADMGEELRKARERYDGIEKRLQATRDGSQFFTVFVHENDAKHVEFLDAFGFDHNRYQDGRRFAVEFAEFQAWKAAKSAPAEQE